MKLEDNKVSKRRSNFYLTANARVIIDTKVREWGVSKSGVVELALRDLADKGIAK